MHDAGYDDPNQAGSLKKDSDPDEIFAVLRKQACDLDLPDQPIYGDGQTVTLQTNILGFKVSVESGNTPSLCTVGISVSSARSDARNGSRRQSFGIEPRIQLVVKEAIFAESIFEFEFDEASLDPTIVVRYDVVFYLSRN